MNLTGPMRLAWAIGESRDIMFTAPWLTESSNQEGEAAAAELQLKHNIAAALDQGFAVDDPLHPEFRSLDQHNQFGLFNPDNRYHVATISTPGEYIIYGKRGTSADFQVQVSGGFNQAFPVPIDVLSLSELVVDDDDRFEIVISSTKSGQNWLNYTKYESQTGGEIQATSVLIRESFMDWENEKSGTWYIVRCDKLGAPSPLPSPDRVNAQYDRAADYLVTLTKSWINVISALIQRGAIPLNKLSEAEETTVNLPGQIISKGRFPMNVSEAIIITVPNSTAAYQSIQVGDLWCNSLDYCNRQTSLTTKQARQSADGYYRYVLSIRDPGVANWLDPAGALTAYVFLRWQGLPDCFEILENPAVDIVDFKDLRKFLPEEEPPFTEEERLKQRAARQAAALTSPRGF